MLLVINLTCSTLVSYIEELFPTGESYGKHHTPQPRGIHHRGLSLRVARRSTLGPGQLPAAVPGWRHCLAGHLAPPLEQWEQPGPQLGCWVLATFVRGRIGCSNVALLGRYWWLATLGACRG